MMSKKKLFYFGIMWMYANWQRDLEKRLHQKFCPGHQIVQGRLWWKCWEQIYLFIFAISSLSDYKLPHSIQIYICKSDRVIVIFVFIYFAQLWRLSWFGLPTKGNQLLMYNQSLLFQSFNKILGLRSLWTQFCPYASGRENVNLK